MPFDLRENILFPLIPYELQTSTSKNMQPILRKMNGLGCGLYLGQVCTMWTPSLIQKSSKHSQEKGSFCNLNVKCL